MAFSLTRIKELAYESGFALCGVARCDEVDKRLVSRFVGGLASGRYGSMEWMGRNLDLRFDPRKLVEGAASIIVCGMSYPLYGKSLVASYAVGEDYHRSLVRSLAPLEHWLTSCGATQCRHFVDSAPVAERYWAVMAGIGAKSRSGMVINENIGGTFLIGGILTDAEFDRYDTPSYFDPCKGCRRCVDACPSGAISEDGTVEASLCRSYLTIEHRGELTPKQAGMIAKAPTVFGCDVCLKVCPYNRISDEPLPDRFALTAESWLEIGTNRLRKHYGDTPLSRASAKMIRRNAACSLGLTYNDDGGNDDDSCNK